MNEKKENENENEIEKIPDDVIDELLSIMINEIKNEETQ